MKLTKIIPLLMAIGITLSLTGCKPEEVPVTPTPVPTTEDETPIVDTQYLLVDTTDYQLKFKMLGNWKEYAGSASIREKAQGVLESSADDTETDSAYFYVLIEPYLTEEGITPKTKFTEQIQSSYESVAFDSISDLSKDDNIKIVYTYTITEDSAKIKNYQLTTIIDGYQVSFIYSAPELIYNIQKGYVNDMIDTAEFTIKTQTAIDPSNTPEESPA